MEILNVLNNNCVSILDDNKNEVILYGNGIGYAKKPGQTIDKNKISKTFVLQDTQKVELWRELLQRVPDEIIELSESVIEQAREELGVELNEALHIALPDHIYGSIENYKIGVILNNAMLLEIKKFYPQEYKIGLDALNELNSFADCDLPEDEAGFIAMHIINARSRTDGSSAQAVIRLVEEINNIIAKTYGEELDGLDKESLIYYRYITHLKFFAQRVITRSAPVDEKFTLTELIRNYRKEYECSSEVCKYIEDKYHYPVGNDERIYLTVHLVQISGKRK